MSSGLGDEESQAAAGGCPSRLVAQSQDPLDKVADILIDWHPAFRVELAQRNMEGPVLLTQVF
jgi:hypothetical protein